VESQLFSKVKEGVDLLDYLVEHLSVDLSDEPGGRFIGNCPFHEENTPSFHVYPEQDGYRSYHCFGCQANGTIIDAVMEKEAFLQPTEAAVWLDQHYDLGLEYDDESITQYRERLDANQAKSRAAQSALAQEDAVGKAARRYLTQVRRLDEPTIQHFELGVDTERVRRGRILIPFRDKGNLPITTVSRALFDFARCRNCNEEVKSADIGKDRQKWEQWAKREVAAGRDPERADAEMPHWGICPHCGAAPDVAKVMWLSGQFPKYRFDKDFVAAEHLYNEYGCRQAVVENIRKQRDALEGIFIVEGYGDVWAAHQSGHHAVIAYNGSTFKAEQIHKVVKLYQDANAELPIVLVPDFDKTGMLKAPLNIKALWNVAPGMQVKVVRHLPPKPDGSACKDLGDVLAHLGPEALDKVLRENTVSAYEWLIHQILDKKNATTGKAYHDRQTQARLVADILHNVMYDIEVEAIIDTLSQAWDGMGEAQVRMYVKSEIRGQESGSTKHLMATIEDLKVAAYEYLKDKFVIKHGFPTLDHELPGGGARLRQLAMFIGKSGTGKSQAIDAPVLTPSGWRQIGDLALGDEVSTPTGAVERVVGVYPQGLREMYRVTLSDGTSCETDLDHMWQVREAGGDWGAWELRMLLDKELRPLRRCEVPVAAGDARGQAGRYIERVELTRTSEAVCIALSGRERMYVGEDMIPLHNTMLCLQLLMNMARQEIRVVFFTLEQPRAQIYLRMVSQVLGVDKYEAEGLVETDDERLNELTELYQNLVVIDNVPADPTMDAEPMTVGKIARTINDLNILHYSNPIQVIAIDHLGQMDIDPKTAPKDVLASDTMAPGFIMQEMAKVTKALNVYTMMLNQLPKSVAEGVEFPYDSGRGGSKQTDNCDYIYCIWRPDREHGISEEDIIARAGQYRLRLSKNRHGASVTAYLKFEGETGRIIPDEEWMPKFDFVDENEDGGDGGEDGFSMPRTQVSMEIQSPTAQPRLQTMIEIDLDEPDIAPAETEPGVDAVEPPVNTVTGDPGEQAASDEMEDVEEADELLAAARDRASSRLTAWAEGVGQ
jgi:DNA primase/replicative DNA helicase